MAVQQLESAPSLGRLYARAVATARGRRGGELPGTVYALDEVRPDPWRLAEYDSVCGFALSDRLPPTYPHVLAFPLAMRLMTDPGFPFPLPGLVHVANRIEQLRPLRLGEELSLRVEARELREHPRGLQFDVLSEVSAGDEVAWKEASTYLKRQGGAGGGATRKPETPPPPTAIWRLGGDVGRRYAVVSGDSNPIHLNPLAARLFGFPRTIAHGMYVAARCLATLEGRLPEALLNEVEFKAPLLIPGTVAVGCHRQEGGWRCDVRDRRTGRPHLAGSALPL